MRTKPLKRKRGLSSRQQPFRNPTHRKVSTIIRIKKTNRKLLKHRDWKHWGGNKSRYGKKHQKKMILVMDHFVPHYDKDTGSRNTFQYIKLFVDMGLSVRFSGYDYTRYEPYTSELEHLGVKVINGKYSRFIKWLKKNGRGLKYAYICRPHVGALYMDVIRKYTRAKIIYNSVDFGYLRELRRYEIEHNPNALTNAEELKKLEYDLFSKSDVVFTVSEYEKSILVQDMPDKKVVVIPTYFYRQEFPLGITTSFEEKNTITFVGGFNHSPNGDGVFWFVREIFPLIQEQLPNVVFNIIGSNPSDDIMALSSGSINVTGYIPDEELERYYSLTKVVVAPLRYGAGVKGKIIEAIAHGIPVVTTPIGIEGIKDPVETIISADTVEQFAAHVIDLFLNPTRWLHIHDKQIEYANRYLTAAYAKKVLNKVIRV